MDLFNLQRKVGQYHDVLMNTDNYREAWQSHLKEFIINQLREISSQVGLNATVEEKVQMQNLAAVIMSLGTVKSGMYQQIDNGIEMPLVKHKGALIYQQLFNGKIIVLIQYPHIENYGQPRPPKTIAIYRPEELKEPYILRHMEEFVQEITAWEDYDDDEPAKKIGFEMNFGNVKKE